MENNDDNVVEHAVEHIVEDVKAARQKLKKQITADVLRVLSGVVLMCLLFLPDLIENLMIVKYVTGFLIAVAVMTHLTRRILFPYIDLKQYAVKALDNPISSAIIFFGICIIIAVTIDTAGNFFSR